MRTVFASLSVLTTLLLLAAAQARAGETPKIRSDVTTVFGYYGVTHGLSDRRYATAWGNVYFASGLGAHAEAHYMDREEAASFVAGGLSWNGENAFLRGWFGSSTDNVGILPEIYGRIEGNWRSSAETGIVISPAATYRSFRNGAEEASVEAEIAKYFPLKTGFLILSAFGRALYVDPGDYITTSFGAGVGYAQAGKVSVGLSLEAGRAAYDGILAPGSFDENYFSIRQHVSFHVTERAEVVGLMEYSSRASYDVYGGHIGLKLYFD